MWVEKIASMSLLVVSSCFINSLEYSPVRSDDGIVWIEWTIDGRADERSCPSFSATTARVTIQRKNDGAIASTAEKSCDDFSSRHELEPGSYRASVTLLDPWDKTVAGPMSAAFVIARDAREHVEVAFATPGPP